MAIITVATLASRNRTCHSRNLHFQKVITTDIMIVKLTQDQLDDSCHNSVIYDTNDREIQLHNEVLREPQLDVVTYEMYCIIEPQ